MRATVGAPWRGERLFGAADAAAVRDARALLAALEDATRARLARTRRETIPLPPPLPARGGGGGGGGGGGSGGDAARASAGGGGATPAAAADARAGGRAADLADSPLLTAALLPTGQPLAPAHARAAAAPTFAHQSGMDAWAPASAAIARWHTAVRTVLTAQRRRERVAALLPLVARLQAGFGDARRGGGSGDDAQRVQLPLGATLTRAALGAPLVSVVVGRACGGASEASPRSERSERIGGGDGK
jgi:hypothetical protein